MAKQTPSIINFMDTNCNSIMASLSPTNLNRIGLCCTLEKKERICRLGSVDDRVFYS